jgi:hypothetical protein
VAAGVAVVVVLGLTEGFTAPDREHWDWTAGGTLALAIVTAGLIVETRIAAREAAAEDRRRLWRAALLEQAENTRRWRRWEPNRGNVATPELVNRPVRLDAVRAALGAVPVPAEVARTFVWLLGDIAWRESLYVADYKINGRTDQDYWWATVDQLQALALLLIDHATAVPGLAAVADAFNGDSMPWVRPVVGTPDERWLAHEQRMAQEQAPPWPSGPAYDASSPKGRDRASSAANARQQQSLADLTRQIP